MFQSSIDLSGAWQLYYGENRTVKRIANTVTTGADCARILPDCVPAKVPGNFELDLYAAGRIGDPYFGMNTLEMQKFENLHLWYVKDFDYSGIADCNTYLRFEGIDTVAEIYLNGELISKVSNMFLTYEIPVPQLQTGKNEIVVHIIPAVIAAREYDIPVSSNALKYNYESLYIRKAASMYGWDIMPRIVSGGIWKPVSLVQKKESRIDDVFLYTLNLRGDGATVTAYYSLHTEEDFLTNFRIRVTGVCGDSVFSGEEEVLHTNGRVSVWVPNAKLWYPKNAGEQNLYTVTVELLIGDQVADTCTKRMGIRTVELSRTSTTDKNGSGDFCFVINGKRVFCMGTNWVPLDAFHSRDVDRIAPALEMAEDIHCNIIRLWGGNVYENEKFFDICDEKGILVWQDFGMGCAVYPQEKKFLDMLEPEITFIVKKLRSHACLALWAGDNECDCAFNWAGTKRNPNENIITRELIPQVLRAHDFTRPYLPSSPFIDEHAYTSGEPTSEDHLWGPRDYFKGEYYKNTVCHFASETGYHGCPSPKGLEKFLSKDALWPIYDENGNVKKEWLVHAACMRANTGDPYSYRIPLMISQVKTLFGEMPDNLNDFALMSQISQAEAKKYFIERFRITRGRRNGIIWWNLVDGWPQISDAVVDYNYVKKLAYHYIKRSQNPILLAFDEPQDGNRITLYGINDLTKTAKITYSVRCVTDGREVARAECVLPSEKSIPVVTVDIEPGEKKFYYMEWTATLEDGTVMTGCNHYFTNIINIDYKAYKEALASCGLLELEGF